MEIDGDEAEVRIVDSVMGDIAKNAPHFRYDGCTTYLPIRNTTGDASQYCAKCYCYMCGKPASECESWTAAEAPHWAAAPRRYARPEAVDYQVLRMRARSSCICMRMQWCGACIKNTLTPHPGRLSAKKQSPKSESHCARLKPP